jgi:uncharacterized protein (TIGR03089 family)
VPPDPARWPSHFAAPDVPALILDLVSTDPGRPRVTWYGRDFERVELSGKTLQNWVSKTANLLVDELGAEPGTRLGLALPGHWRTLVWLLAGWSVGAHVVVLDSAGREHQEGAPTTQVDVLVTDRPSAPPPGTIENLLVVVSLPALATRFAGDVPVGAVDAAVEVRLQPDVFVVTERPAPGDPALTAAGRTLAYADLIPAAASRSPGFGATDAEPPVRLLTGAGPERALESYLAPLVAGGSVVIHHDLAGLDDAALAHLRGQEAVTALDDLLP